MQNVQCAICDVKCTKYNLYCGAGKVPLPVQRQVFTTFLQEPYSQHLLSSKTNCASVFLVFLITFKQGGITCGAIDEPRKSSKAIDERVIINFRDKNVVIARFSDKNVYR